MAITGSTDLGNGILAVTVDHDPTAVATDVPAGSIIIDANGNHFQKIDDGATTNVGESAANNNLSATVDPVVGDDNTLGYEPGSHWVNVTLSKGFINVDASTGAAVWLQIGLPSGAAGGQLGGTYPNPDVRGLRETGGPTLLAMGAVPDGQLLKRSGSGIVGETVGPTGFRFGWDVPGTAVTTLMKIEVAGRVEARLSAATVDPVPTTASHLDSNTGHVQVDITTLTVAGTIRLTGTSFDPATGGTTPGDTEDMVVTGTDSFQTAKLWRGTVVLSSVGGFDGIVDTFFIGHFELGKDWTVDEIRVDYKVTGGVNTSRIVLQKFAPTVGLTTILDETIANIMSPTTGGHERSGLSTAIGEAAGERLYMFIEVLRLDSYHFEIIGS